MKQARMPEANWSQSDGCCISTRGGIFAVCQNLTAWLKFLAAYSPKGALKLTEGQGMRYKLSPLPVQERGPTLYT